jgi:hypothetical protein
VILEVRLEIPTMTRNPLEIHHHRNSGADPEFDSLKDSGPEIDKFGSNVEFMEEEGNAATLQGTSLEQQEQLSSPRGYRIPNVGLPYTFKRK